MPTSEKDFTLPLYAPPPLHPSALLSHHPSDPPPYEMGNNISTLFNTRSNDHSALTRPSMSFELDSIAVEPGPVSPLRLTAARSSAAAHANAASHANANANSPRQTWTWCQSFAGNMGGLADVWTPFFKKLMSAALSIVIIFLLARINLVDLARAIFGTGGATKA
ncbi:hypothetical protein PENSPDRAFT_691033 [Peniophora sp. CONT]|nr:hypothetical protein PENSPDRAFT_691033 [Peniophora sp. CONT]